MTFKQIGLDKFRLIVAILIIAIHTYPLLSISETADFIFSHCLCRIGVPFFLMVTGFFIIPSALKDKGKLIKYTIRILKIYLICIILYIPINIYAGQLSNMNFIEILKNIFINGTFYHLWYFPALILGIWIIYFLFKHISKKATFICVTILYIIGIFGDSYFGISDKFHITRNIYNFMFSIFNYTRNGLFYVPIFLFLGYMFSQKKWNITKKKNLCFIVIFTILMIIEGLILHTFNLQKHDSMYFMLIPLMIGIFNLILQSNNENNKKLRTISTIIYILHPLFIILVRGLAKIVHLQDLMINNSILHYLLVVISTVTFSVLFEVVNNKIKSK